MERRPSALLTDLYHLTMMQAYLREGMTETAVFEFFSRRLPQTRSFLMAAGLEQVLDYLESLHFDQEELDWLDRRGGFDKSFLDYLARLRFTGTVHAMPEGTVFFADEPILRVAAPMPEAQLVETRLINLLHYQTLIASKAARMVLAAPGKQLVDFGLRRAHGAEAGLLAARAAFIAGFAASATVEAEHAFGIPSSGTMAHSFIQAHDDEAEAFMRFARAYPAGAVLLIDTYDTQAGARKVVALASRLKAEGLTLRGVRIDSGDLIAEARAVRRILDEGGLGDVHIFVSGNIDEHALADIIGARAPIDGFGIGTRLTTSADAPYLDCAYKLQEYAGQARRKRSAGKATWPGRKQVYRRFDGAGRMLGDVVTLETDEREGQKLIEPVMAAGRRLHPSPNLAQVRQRAAASLDALPAPLRGLEGGAAYPVEIGAALRRLAEEVDARTGG
ncbi:MAG: nicotinate phosphoribosyltransferase [Alphaproteobacteria bacterium]